MVQIIDRLPSTFDRFNEAFGKSIEAAGSYMGAKKESRQKEREFAQQMQLQQLKGEQGIATQIAKYEQKKKLLDSLGLGDEFVQGQPETQNQPEPQRSDQFDQEGNINVGEVKVPTRKLIPQSKIMQATAIDPSIGNQLQKYNDNILAQQRHEDNLALKKQKETPEHKRELSLASEQAKADIDYNKQLQSSATQHQIKTDTLNKLEKLNEKGVTGKPYEKLLEKFGLVNLTSEGRREFAADVKNLITDIRSILGAQFTGFEFQTILNAYPSADFSQEANRAIINNLKEFQDIRHKEFEISNEIKKNNKGKIPEDFQSLVNAKLMDYAQDRLPSIKANTRKIMHEEYGIPQGHMLMFDPKGEPLSVPDEMMDQYLELGATLP